MVKNRIPNGCDQQGRLEDGQYVEWKPDPLWWVDDVFIAIGFTAAVLFLLAVVGLI